MKLIIVSANGIAPHNLGQSFFKATPYFCEHDSYGPISPLACIDIRSVKQAQRTLMLLAKLCPDLTIVALLRVNSNLLRTYTVESGSISVRCLTALEVAENQ